MRLSQYDNFMVLHNHNSNDDNYSYVWPITELKQKSCNIGLTYNLVILRILSWQTQNLIKTCQTNVHSMTIANFHTTVLYIAATFVLFIHILNCFVNKCTNLYFRSSAELIYKEVMNFEERTKNGVVKGQPSPSGTLSA